MFSKLFASWKKDSAAQQTIRELSALSDKELHDIGITRGDIHAIAHGSEDYTRIRGNDNLKGWA